MSHILQYCLCVAGAADAFSKRAIAVSRAECTLGAAPGWRSAVVATRELVQPGNVTSGRQQYSIFLVYVYI